MNDLPETSLLFDHRHTACDLTRQPPPPLLKHGLGRLRSDRVFRLPTPPRTAATISRPAKHGGEFFFAEPGTWPDPDTVTFTETSRYGGARATAWDRLHPRLTRRAAWLEHDGDLPVLEGTLIRLVVDRLPGDGDPKPLWLWSSRVGASPTHVDRLWQTFLRWFDLEHTFRFFKQTLGWTAPKLRDPHAADWWTWLVIAAYTQLRLARHLAQDLRRPWERPAPEGRLTPARVSRVSEPARQDRPGQRVHRTHHARSWTPCRVEEPPARHPASHDVGKTTKRAITLEEHRQRTG
jgi:hypothetical protein